MPQSTLILQLIAPLGTTYKVFTEQEDTYLLVTTQEISPWPDEYSLKDILQQESEERKNGKVITRDASKTTEKSYITFSQVIQKLTEENPELSALNPWIISEEYSAKLQQLIDLSCESGKFKAEWLEELTD